MQLVGQQHPRHHAVRLRGRQREALREALEAPVRQIAFNAGQEGSVVIDTVRKNKSWDHGYDATGYSCL